MGYLIEHMKGVLVFWQIVFYIIAFVMVSYTNTEHPDVEELAKKHKFLLIVTIIPFVVGVILTTIYLFLYS